MLVEIIIQHKFFSFTLEEFGQILRIPIEGQCSFSDKWSLDNLEFSVPSRGLYETTPPTPEDIKLYVQFEREEPLTRTPHVVTEIMSRNVFVTCSIVSRLSRHTILHSSLQNEMELVTHQARLVLPYGMLSSRLFNHVMSIYPEFFSDRYVLYDRVMHPLTPHYERKTRRDYGTKRGRHSTFDSSSSTFDHPSSSHHIDDDNDKEQADWRDDTDDEPEDQELEAYYMYMAKIQEVIPYAIENFGPIFDVEPLQKVQTNDDNYNVFANERIHHEQPKSVNDKYLVEHSDSNVIIDSLDVSLNG
ncbi:hypothetical protein Tco_0950327 [Tanacetum coccineum]